MGASALRETAHLSACSCRGASVAVRAGAVHRGCYMVRAGPVLVWGLDHGEYTRVLLVCYSPQAKFNRIGDSRLIT